MIGSRTADSWTIGSRIIDSSVIDSELIGSKIADSETLAGCSKLVFEDRTRSASSFTPFQMGLSLARWDEPGSVVELFDSSRTKSDTAWARLSGGLVKYTSAHRPMCAASKGLSRGFSSGSGKIAAFDSSVGCATVYSPERAIGMIALPANKVVNSIAENGDRKAPEESITCLSGCGFELVELGIVLTGELAFWRLAIEIGARAIVKGCVQVYPYLGIGISSVFWSLRSLRQSKIDH